MPEWDRLPGELNWTLAKPNYGTKKKKIDDQQVLERLGRQEQKRSTEDGVISFIILKMVLT